MNVIVHFKNTYYRWIFEDNRFNSCDAFVNEQGICKEGR